MAFVTTPASTLIVPSNTTADPVAGFIFNAAPDVRVKAPPAPDVRVKAAPAPDVTAT